MDFFGKLKKPKFERFFIKADQPEITLTQDKEIL